MVFVVVLGQWSATYHEVALQCGCSAVPAGYSATRICSARQLRRRFPIVRCFFPSRLRLYQRIVLDCALQLLLAMRPLASLHSPDSCTSALSLRAPIAPQVPRVPDRPRQRHQHRPFQQDGHH